MAESEYDLKKAKDYQRIRQVLTLVQLVWTPVVLFIVLLTPLTFFFDDLASGWIANPYLHVALYTLLFFLYLTVVDFPLGFYSGFILEHRFGLSNQSLAAWFGEYLKRTLLSLGLMLPLIVGLYSLIWHFEAWWVLAWAGYAVVSYVLGKIFPVWIVPLFYRYGKVEEGTLKKRILDLAARYGMPVENVYSLNLSKTTKKANAAFMGMGKTKRVVLSDTLLEHFTEDEIETVVAHELGHFKHRDILKQLAFGMVTSFAAFWIAFRLMEYAAPLFGFSGAEDVAALPLLFLVFYFFGLVLMPIQNGFSRILERAADRFALKAFPRADVFITCMEKLGKVNLADPEPNPVIEWFFYDHPAIGKRIQMAQGKQNA